jgi:hypothetical protein
LIELIDVPDNLHIMQAKMIEYNPDFTINFYENFDYTLMNSFKLNVGNDCSNFDCNLKEDSAGFISDKKISDVKELFPFLEQCNIHSLKCYFSDYQNKKSLN